MALETSTDHVIKESLERVWQAWTDPKEVRAWLNLHDALIPLTVGEPLLWSFNRRGRVELAFRGTLREITPQALCVYDWEVPGNDTPTSVTVRFEKVDEKQTRVSVRHTGFSESLRSRLEFDGYDHHWWHYLERLAGYLEYRPFQFHSTLTPPKTGIIPLGVTPETGMVVQDVVVNSAAEAVGMRAGDEIRSIDGIALTEMEDFHRWLDEAVPGQQARFELKDRTLTLVLRPFTA
ncbi:SRPBCC domain-containing protein [Streptacidiphilus sp. P02-A3a]|uniref:SRPBCC domain-containing protein n=1 Tax=Streptacidiphilus sp. P02-A3a TaxID=2704468 RepID=UPI0015FCCFF2|nr:SRPBCC domain-containing protein [Streptacidiphilus sp. P02-A3a]QMU73407.1 PDZ domain-containing protein [Streptacidiphilus sp. P02-A3a]